MFVNLKCIRILNALLKGKLTLKTTTTTTKKSSLVEKVTDDVVAMVTRFKALISLL